MFAHLLKKNQKKKFSTDRTCRSRRAFATSIINNIAITIEEHKSDNNIGFEPSPGFAETHMTAML